MNDMSDVPASARTQVDPITVSIVEELLVSIVREMRVTFSRSAFSSVISEGHDFSCVLLSQTGELVAMSEDHPGHSFPLAFAAKEILTRFDGDIHSGDVFFVNDPYICGTHLNDVALYYPRVKSGRLRIFPAIRAHWADIGGGSAGSLSGNATHIFIEGLVIPPLRLVSKGEMNTGCLDLIMSNVRGKTDRYGDLKATIGACALAQQRLDELEAKYGSERLDAIVATILDRTEGRVRKAIEKLPKGSFRFENYTDNDGVNAEPQRVSVELTVKEGGVHADFTGTSPQAPGPLNGGPAMVATAYFMVLKSYLDPKAPVNAGCFRPLTLHVPPGSFLNASFPAAMGGAGDLRRTVESCVLGALSQMIPDEVCGDNKGSANHCYVAGPLPGSNETFIYYEYPAGGIGAVEGLDGDHAIRTYTEGDFNTVLPVESLENLYPMIVLNSAVRPDSCGDGEWRGGLGMERQVRLTSDNASLSVLTDRVVVPPYGVNGGTSGMGNRFTVIRDGVEIEASAIPGKIGSFPLKASDIVVLRSAGGGGYGDPLERDPAAVLADLKRGYVTPAYARARYGIVLAGDHLDETATAAERQRLREVRVAVKVTLTEADEYYGYRRVCRLSPATAKTLGITDGQLVEIIAARGAPLRCWARLSAATPDGVVPIGPVGAQILGLAEASPVRVRPVATPYTHPPMAGLGEPSTERQRAT